MTKSEKLDGGSTERKWIFLTRLKEPERAAAPRMTSDIKVWGRFPLGKLVDSRRVDKRNSLSSSGETSTLPPASVPTDEPSHARVGGSTALEPFLRVLLDAPRGARTHFPGDGAQQTNPRALDASC